MFKKGILLVVGTACMVYTVMAQDSPVLLFPGGAPGETVDLIEKADTDGAKTGGEPVLRISNVCEPTVTIYQAPEDIAVGTAMIVCPGGGYNILAYDLEGDEVCEWLNSIGITAVLLKYRVPRREGKEKHEAPLQDVQRAIGYIRAHADNLGIDKERIGVMGFSAGAHLSATASNNFQQRTYPYIDATDKVSCRPDFCLLVYPAYLDRENFGIAPELKVTSQTPPTMIIQTEDDKSYINSSLFYYYALKEAGVSAWMHLYSKGGHGYGLRDTGATVNEWPERAEDWFREIGVIE
ncbi:acetyl esterase/lipase [Parabacteroides sp. PF5-5]|uniref:alpha/beta hydrolase n=1 Tax=unclassified Parabacteroides TaxID=2649774 RepID=UPI00247456E3|nr:MULTISPECIES: alpha/beta hydrolase [unclassified Parabacteroides]MDH6304757.1 acetyl esterase/lipase [Parabacteroides sp. PH5-39]MDH6315628.1 acetyl esterase/lipase [Parabacteroides sp. PF5-13]MDH6319289.1 acetyl esterase/lipase [Parabacteroides sp. PH5-13]MDH6323020.1 acetyl esterase/lipase [Parabacteroides sp. PH5-8]MDH6326821.1 acetyl esterase/lipase [Parabacteroides sp. PH5-41]